jgi:lysophospholipase L1-like esterase
VFLGDSFTWGYEIATEAMFVNRLRPRLAKYEVFNLAHRGFGTDQSLLAFRGWRYGGRLRLVVLMFCENDLHDNAADFRYGAYKPKAEIVGEELVLTNVPVPPTDKWADKGPLPAPPLGQRLLAVALSSHFLHDVDFRLNHVRRQRELDPERHTELIPLTSRIVRQLRDEVAARGGELLFVAIPSKRQFRHERGFTPYQRQMETLCGRLGVPYLDLAPALERSVLRTYFRIGDHWNAHGNKVVAQALLEHLEARTKLVPGPDD